MDAEIGAVEPQPRNICSHRKLEEVRKNPPLEPSKGA